MLNQFPPPYPKELLYSVLARYHKYSGNRDAGQSYKELFGDLMRNAVFLPTGLNNLYLKILGKPAYTIDELINKHTLYPYYACYLHGFQRRVLKEQIIGSKASRFLLGSISKFLRLCPDCIEQDYRKTGEVYWHVEHQIAAVFCCPEHLCRLIDRCPECGKYVGDYRDSFTLCRSKCVFCRYEFTRIRNIDIYYDRHAEIKVSKNISFLIENWQGIEDKIPNDWAIVYRKRLRELGLGESYQEVPWGKLEQNLLTEFGDEYLKYISKSSNKIDLKTLYFSERRYPNTIKNILFTCLLYGSFSNFVDTQITSKNKSENVA